jgi:hypothetical protein
MINKRDFARSLTVAIAFALSCHSASAQTGSNKLIEFTCNILIADRHHVGVATLIQINNAEHSPVSLTLVHYPTQEIDGLRIIDQKGNLVAIAEDLTVGALVVSIASDQIPSVSKSELVFRLEYDVVDATSGINRIPIPVPSARTPFGERAVHVALVLPPGTISVGDAFPSLNWQDQSHGEATLSNVPSLAMIDWKPVGSVRFTDAGMLAILLTGSLVWWFRSRGGARI